MVNDATAMPLSLHPGRLDRVVGEAIDGVLEPLTRRGAGVQRQLAPLPDYPLDEALMREALDLILAEAVRLVDPKRGVRVTVKANRNAQMAAIKAPGPGLDDAARQSLFNGEPLPGTLARARAIVSAHGGILWTNGAAGLGITFYLTLPARPA